MREKKGTADDCDKVWPSRDEVVVQPALFGADKFNFTKVLDAERLVPHVALAIEPLASTTDDGAVSSVRRASYSVLVNKFPLAYLHVLLVASELRPQVLTRHDLYAAIDFVTHHTRELFVFFSSWSAGATVNHLHMQLYPRADVPLFTLAVEPEPEHTSSALGARYSVRDYPAAHHVYDVLDATSVARACADLAACIESNRPHNVLVTAERIYLFPRVRDPLLRQAARELYGQPPACLEFAGVFNAYDLETFEALNAERMRELMRMCTESLS